MACALLLLASSGFAQSSAGVQAPGSTSPGSTTSGSRRGRQQPCWQSAGISQQTVEQRKQLEETTHSQVESVCANSSLNAQQKRDQIRQLHEQARKQMEALVTPQQEEAVKACRQQRGEGRSENRGGERRGGEGACGEMPAGNASGGSKTQPQSRPEPEQR
jgi:Spy/CpxP family protein refolding chaperone